MQAYYDILDKIKNTLQADEFVNTVTTGSIFDIDLNKQTMYPLSHLTINSGSVADEILQFEVSVYCMDIVDKSSGPTTDIFKGNDNNQDVLNTQLAVAVRLVKMLNAYENAGVYTIEGEPTLEPFTERFEHYLAGWVVTFTMHLPNDMSRCGDVVIPTCPSTPYQIKDTADNVLYNGTIISGDVLIQHIANSTAIVKNSLGTIQSTTEILAEGTEEIILPDTVLSFNYGGTITDINIVTLSDITININN